MVLFPDHKHLLYIVYPMRALQSPNTSIVRRNQVNQFNCEVHCHDSLLVTWQLNETFLSELGPSSGMPRVVSLSNYDHQCSPASAGAESVYNSTLEVIPETLDPFTVQCIALHVCDGPGDSGDYTRCRPTVCYGQLTNVEGERS